MVPPPKDVTPDVNSKWLALRQKHQEDTDEFQRDVTRRRAEFESRIVLSRKRLLQKHIGEEAEFWGGHGRGPSVAKSATPARNTVRFQTPTSAQVYSTTSEKTATPVPPCPTPKKTQQLPPVTPRKAPQPTKANQAPPAPTKSRPLASQKQGVREVIDLCDSDDDDLPVAKKTPVLRKPMAQSSGRQRPIVHEPEHQDSEMSEATFEDIRSTIPQATLELFGDRMTKHLVNLLFQSQQPRANSDFQSTLPLYVKDEVRQHGSSSLHDPFTSSSASPLSQGHGLPGPSTPPFSPRPFTATSPFSRRDNDFRPFTPPTTPGHGGSYSPSTSFSPRATSVFSPSVHHSAFGDISPSNARNSAIGSGFGSTASKPFSQRPASEVPPVSQATFQSSPPSQFSLSRSRALQTEQRSRTSPNYHGQKSDPAATNHISSSPFTGAHHPQAGGVISDDLRAGRSQNFVQEWHEEADRNKAGDVDMQMADASPTENAAMPGATHGKILLLRLEHVANRNAASTACGNGLHAVKNVHANIVNQTCSLPQDQEHQLPTPSPSHASVASEFITPKPFNVQSSPSSFKKPSLPASAETNGHDRQTAIAPQGQHVRAGTTKSHASSFTLPASPRYQRSASTASRTSGVSAHTGATQSHKRKISIDLSSDEEDISDYATSEPYSPSADHAAILVKDVPAFKKTKTASGFGVATKITSLHGKGKNAFGFKKLVAPKPKSKPAATPSRVPGKHSTATSARLPSIITGTTPKSKSSKTSVSQPSKRRAALSAVSKIHGLFDDELEFATECAVEASDAMEDARLPKAMGQMSITPAPQDESVAKLSNAVDDSDSELDISELIYVDGVIVHSCQIE
jgi:hypothetical protein